MALLKSPPTYYKVLEGAVGERFALEPGQLLRCDAAVPKTLQAFLSAGILEALTGAPSPGLDVRSVSDRWFESPPAERPDEALITEDQLLARIGLNMRDLSQARGQFGFPRPHGTRTVANADEPDKPDQRLYRWSEVAAWLRAQRALFAPIWRMASLDD